MNDATFQFWIIAFFSAWFALVAAVVLLAVRTGKAIDERHARRICDCDEARGPDEWAVKAGPCEPGDCDVCDTWRAKIEAERAP